MGQVFYRSWIPGSFSDPTYNINGAIPELESLTSNVPRELPKQPIEFYDNRVGSAFYYLANIQGDYTTAGRIFYPVSDEAYRFAPAEPIRSDVFNQMVQKTSSPNVVGQAPTQGVYTGLNDLGYE